VVKVCNYAAPGETLAKAAESVLDAGPIEQRQGITDAASIS